MQYKKMFFIDRLKNIKTWQFFFNMADYKVHIFNLSNMNGAIFDV